MNNAAKTPAKRWYLWQGKDQQDRMQRGEIFATGTAMVNAQLRRQGIISAQVRIKPRSRVQAIREKEVALFTRQLAAMLKAGIPLLQSFEIVARSQSNETLAKLIRTLRDDIETGSSLHQALARHPKQFDALYCNLVAAGEQAGMLDTLLASLANHKEKILHIKSQIRTAMIYPAAIIACAVLVTAVIMIWVVPSFKQVFSSFGASLPWATQVVIYASDFLVSDGWILAALAVLMSTLLMRLWRKSPIWRHRAAYGLLRLPLLGRIARNSAIARWTRTLSTMFGAGVPLVDALRAVAGASGNAAFADSTAVIVQQVSDGVSLAASLEQTALFPGMVGQMVAIGEESGTLDQMLDKVADFYEIEVNEAVASLSIMLEPIIMLVLGVIIGGLVIAMYLPIFKLGSIV
ncbi:type IV pilus assembly protein PilC [Herbaspirillum sp. Sphag1AN]|uniref:type II secretion system F family protein n=1 Tax=unclassified Herbaspirillum TaxID=2624150 RepID=UPI001620B3B7|nr:MULTISPECIES: type II secretion system F family protein [unclassified Herbaspirillum]MBB3213750.1 type IV pilus assembly protein PilC [Herbaspirillum sp. Sphag1AN]MBB3246947.1 type IV pilus assembly protein PilC [Herbaspirillum sp. Sphag64]